LSIRNEFVTSRIFGAWACTAYRVLVVVVIIELLNLGELGRIKMGWEGVKDRWFRWVSYASAWCSL